jgi:hypothetical protein
MSAFTQPQTTPGLLARNEAQRMYRRVLGAWASDCLRLRRAGLDRPCRRQGATSGIGWGALNAHKR